MTHYPASHRAQCSIGYEPLPHTERLRGVDAHKQIARLPLKESSTQLALALIEACISM